MILLCVLTACTKEASGPSQQTTDHGPLTTPGLRGPIFADVTAQSGIDFRYRNGEEGDQFAILEFIGGGVALIDYDQDGLLDIFVTGGGHFGPNQEILGYPNRLYRNEGNGHFRDVTAEVGLDKPLFYSHGCAVGDYDNDGWPDLLVTGYGRLALYHNNHGKFEEVTEKAGLLDKRPLHWSTSAAWGDFDGDGYLDLYVAHYADWSFANNPSCRGYRPEQPRDLCTPRHFKPLPHALYRNNGDGTFRDVSGEAGLGQEPGTSGRGLGVLVADFDDDGKLDIYVANDATDNFLYLNQGVGSLFQGGPVNPNGQATGSRGRPEKDSRPLFCKFAEVGVSRSVAGNEEGMPDGSMGVDAADYDGSGLLSIFVTNYVEETHALYRNRGGGRFQHVSARAGISAIGRAYSGFGTSFIDYDNNGVEDLVIFNGHVMRYPPPPATLAQRPVLFRNEHGRFVAITDQAGPYFQTLHRSRGVALGDLDNDGRIDLVVSTLNEPVAILRNVLDTGNHWLGVQLIGRPNPDAVGAILTLEVGSQKLVRHVKGGGSYLASSDRRVVFGLGTANSVGKLTVRWPSGKTQTWDGLATDQYWRLVEGEEAPQPPLHQRAVSPKK